MIATARRLARRRQALVALAGAQRAELAAALRPAARRVAALDRMVAAVRRHPLLYSVAAVALALLGPRRLLPWALRAAPLVAILRRARLDGMAEAGRLAQ